MKASIDRYQKVISLFPKLDLILLQLDTAGIKYTLGGSATMYIQGNARLPNDIDIMFSDSNHKQANELFGIDMEHIERPTVSMNKSSPFSDGTFDFLSRYTAIADGKTYWSPRESVLEMKYKDRIIRLVPSEKIAIFKLIGRREHHNDLHDFTDLYNNPHFDRSLFWQITDELNVRKTIKSLLVNSRLVEQ